MDGIGADFGMGDLDLAPIVWSSDSLIVVVIDRDGIVRQANSTFLRLAGRDPRGDSLRSFVGDGQAEAFGDWLSRAGDGWRTRAWGLLPDADLLPLDLRCSVRRDANSGSVLLVGEPLRTDDVAAALLDVNETLVVEHRRLDRERERLGREARQDALTGVGNRRAFDAWLTHRAARSRTDGVFSLVMLDIDHFKALNDRYGHPAGDGVLRWLGGILQATARRGDVVARYGGEEFVAVLADADVAGATWWAGRLRRAIAEDRPAGIDVDVTVSMGVATWQAGDSGADVVARADKALYAAKRAGRDRIVTDGVPSIPPDEAPSDLPDPIWQSSAIGLAVVEEGVIRQANDALLRLVDGVVGMAVGNLVLPAQAPALVQLVRDAGSGWTRVTLAIARGKDEAADDHVVWAKRYRGVVELLLEPAIREGATVAATLLALVDELIDGQRELQRRSKALERALAGQMTAERLNARFEELLPGCPRCGRIRQERSGVVHWLPVPAYLDAAEAAVMDLCEACLTSRVRP